MQFIFSNTLSVAVTKHIDLSAIRRETQSWLALLIMQHGTISLWRLAGSGASAAQTAAVQALGKMELPHRSNKFPIKLRCHL